MEIKSNFLLQVPDLHTKVILTCVQFKDKSKNVGSAWLRLIDPDKIEQRMLLGLYEQVLKGDLSEWQLAAFDIDKTHLYLKYCKAGSDKDIIIPILLVGPDLDKVTIRIQIMKGKSKKSPTPCGEFRIDSVACGENNHSVILGFNTSDQFDYNVLTSDSQAKGLVESIWEQFFCPTFQTCDPTDLPT